MELASILDHTILSADCTKEDVKRICEEAINNQFAAVCIPPYFVKQAATLLEKSPIKVVTAIGYPLGHATTPAKVEEIKRAINDDVDEVDVVVNLCAVKNGDWNYVSSDIDSITTAVHLRGKVIKVIIETSILVPAEIKRLCEICANKGVNYVITSTENTDEGASPEVVSFIKTLLPPSIKIKAAGGIRTASHAQRLIEAGAHRIGSSSCIQLLN